jgi:hypothetical protein
MERRPFLAAGSASVLALAAKSSSVFGDTPPADPVDIVREYHRRANAAESVDAFAEQIPELAHSASPLLDVATDVPGVFDGALRQRLVDTEVVGEDLSTGEILDVSDFFAGAVSREEVETIAENNAVVAVTLETEDVIGGVFAKEWLVAPEDGEWRLVWFEERESPRAAAREFFRQVKSADSLEALDQPVGDLSHSTSPLVNVAEYTPWYFRGLRRQELVQTHVVAENVEPGEIASEFTAFTSWASRRDIEAVAGENAVVALSLRDEELGIENLTQKLLVAPEFEEWRIVWL